MLTNDISSTDLNKALKTFNETPEATPNRNDWTLREVRRRLDRRSSTRRAPKPARSLDATDAIFEVVCANNRFRVTRVELLTLATGLRNTGLKPATLTEKTLRDIIRLPAACLSRRQILDTDWRERRQMLAADHAARCA